MATHAGRFRMTPEEGRNNMAMTKKTAKGTAKKAAGKTAAKKAPKKKSYRVSTLQQIIICL